MQYCVLDVFFKRSCLILRAEEDFLLSRQDRNTESRDFAALSGQTREETFRRRSAGSFPEQRLVIEFKNRPLQKEKEKI